MAKPTPSRDRRLPSRNVHPTNSQGPSPAALQGALKAFNYATHNNNNNSVLTMVDKPPVSLLDSDPDLPPELPEPGSIKDKIAKFSADPTTLAPNDGPRITLGDVADIAREKSPQLLAAELAVGNSPVPRSKPTNTSLQRVESQPTGSTPSRGLLSPVPIRKAAVNPRFLNPSLDDRGSPTAVPPIQQKPNSPRPSKSPRPPITKPRPAPPVPRKPSPITGGPSPTGDHVQRRNTSNERPSKAQPVRPKASPSTLSEERAPALPPRRAATLPAKDIPEYQLSPGRVKSPAWQSSSSATSLYSQSQNPSSSSLFDVSKSGSLDAVAASSLASSRALYTKTSPPPPPPQRRRRSRSRSLLQLQHQSKKGRPPNPSPGSFRETLRTQSKSDDEDEDDRRHHRRIINKHPHKHQEGDRKRWRSEVTEKERKRYEGVWAANKGLLIPPSRVLEKNDPAQELPSDMYPNDALDMVVNLVVQDIWSRSRLPDHVLEQIWNLVDRQKIGLLTRAEFVVGMWLIDQQLKGHKLPASVPESVWASVLRVPGISLDNHCP
ncbi:protein irs4 [Aspergillus lucknowensis]|uniref:EH domain-containing protein n=1 Tax=Aspergillus lucknowensis TaxID=176173 RepID=A0ABR4LMR4_9EURO